jgi:coronin-1B/1C/6
LHENEIMRAYKTVNDSLIEPVSFVVPRRAEVFQDDIYPPTSGLKPGVSGAEWFDGKTALPPKISLESVYDGTGIKEMPSDYKPSKVETPISPPATKTEAPKPKPAPEPTPTARAAPTDSIKSNKDSMSAMASKFADKGAAEDSSDDDASSFEEVPKPVGRPAAVTAARQEQKTRGPEIKSEPPVIAPESVKPPAAQPSPTKAAPESSVSRPTDAKRTPSALWSKGGESPAASGTTTPSTATATVATAGGAADSLKSHLADLKEQNARILSLLEQQSRALGRQTDQIMFLTEEVEKVKSKSGSTAPAGGNNRELEAKIRELELKLEEAEEARNA